MLVEKIARQFPANFNSIKGGEVIRYTNQDKYEDNKASRIKRGRGSVHRKNKWETFNEHRKFRCPQKWKEEKIWGK